MRMVRDSLMRGLVVWGAAVLAITELLSAFHALRRPPLAGCWLAFAAVCLIRFARIPGTSVSRDPITILCVAGSAAILLGTAITALASPPNSADAMAYHMPRVVYWAEQASIRFFPTPYLNQIMLQPMAEYIMLHLYLLTGGDRLLNLVQWGASLASIVGVSSVAADWGAGPRAQSMAALFCATIPSGILASSGAKNDYVLAFWLVAAVYFAGRFTRSAELRDALFFGLALGLALLTKGTAYVFAPWLLLAVLWRSKRLLPGAAVAVGAALLVNAPHYVRNVQLSGSPLGFDSAHGDGFFRWRNETFGWKQTASNILRNISEQSGGRSTEWNQRVYNWVVAAHHAIGIDVNDPTTTWRWSVFRAPRNANHEADANSKWHLLILVAAVCVAAFRAVRGRGSQPAIFGLALLLAFVSFCAYLKWQPFLARLFLPLIVASAPVVGVAFGSVGGWRIALQGLLCLFLLSSARLPVLENWTRPLRGPRNVWQVPRDAQYFSDMVQWGNRETYEKTLAYLEGRPCGVIGTDITHLTLEYPLMARIRERRPGMLFVHTGVSNPSARFAPSVPQPPCIVVCLDCAGDAERENLYRAYPRKTVIDRFVVFAAEK